MSSRSTSNSRLGWVTGIALSLSMTAGYAAVAGGGPKTPQAFAEQYMAAYNKNDKAALSKFRLPVKVKSPMLELMDDMTQMEMSSGAKYDKFEVSPAQADMCKPMMGLDGKFYEPNIKPTNVIKFSSHSKDATSSSSFPIGVKNGVYYMVTPVLAAGAQPVYVFGWQRFTPPKATWSVLMPNEPEPGRAALERESGKEALNDPDAYGVVKNTADIKTFQHFYRCGEEGKRVDAADNKETFRATCTTYTPETLTKWYSDAAKNLSEAVDYRVRADEGKLVDQKDIDLKGAPGKSFEIRTKDGTTYLCRVYWIKDALYELTFESKKDQPDRASADKFLGSLDVQ